MRVHPAVTEKLYHRQSCISLVGVQLCSIITMSRSYNADFINGGGGVRRDYCTVYPVANK